MSIGDRERKESKRLQSAVTNELHPPCHIYSSSKKTVPKIHGVEIEQSESTERAFGPTLKTVLGSDTS
jgi:hypothetical protein